MRNSLKSRPKEQGSVVKGREDSNASATGEPVPADSTISLAELVFQDLPRHAPSVETIPHTEIVRHGLSLLVGRACCEALPPLTEQILRSYLEQKDANTIAEETGTPTDQVQPTVDSALRALRGVRLPKSPLHN